MTKNRKRPGQFGPTRKRERLQTPPELRDVPKASSLADELVTITIWKNPLKPTDRHVITADPGETLIGWLREHHPQGFGRPIMILWNDRHVEVEHSDQVMEAGDVIGIYVQPGAVALPYIIAAAINAAIAIAAKLIVGLIFGKPKRPGSPPKPDPVYSLNGAPNAARIGEPVPAIYGQVITVPDWGSQPYTFFSNNNMYLDVILVIGHGHYQIQNIILADTPVSALIGGAVQYWVFPPESHAQTMGTIEDATTVMENVITSPEVADQELSGDASGGTGVTWVFCSAAGTAPSTITLSGDKPDALPSNTFQIYQNPSPGPNSGKTFNATSYVAGTGVITVSETNVTTDSARPTAVGFAVPTTPSVAGPFVVGKPGVRGNRIMADFVLPGGLYTLSDKGKLTPAQVTLLLTAQPIDDSGANAGAPITKTITYTRATNTPVRITEIMEVPTGRYTVKVTRTTPPPADTQTVNNVVWSALKFRLIRTVTPVYGDTTLLVMRIRATNGIAAEAASRIRVQCTRLLAPLGSGAEIATRDPADAFVDVMVNPIYGAKRPLAEVDIATLAQLKTLWAGRAKFDGIFNSKSTIWEALTLVLQPADAMPLPDGNLMSALQDGRKALRTQFFSDANMVKGSLQIGYQFDRPGDYAGFQVEYRDPATFNPLYAVYPPGAVDLEQTALFGCTDGATALGYARLLWQRRLHQRKNCQFETELEGMLPRFGDRIAVASQLPLWGQSGVITAVLGMTLRTDQMLDWSGSGHVVVLRDEEGHPSALINVTRGGDDDEIVLGSDPGFAIGGGLHQEATHYSFGTSSQVVRDFIVANLEHQGGVRTRVSGLRYDPAIWTGTLPWLEVPF